jgi:tryptophan-rich sensory protein
MRIRLGLLRWYLSPPLMMGQGACMGLAWAYVLLKREPLFEPNDFWPWLFILFHSFLVVKNLRGNGHVHRYGFLYARGFDRDTLWVHAMLAHVLGVLMVWLPVALFVWLPIRGAVQDHLLKSPYYPLFMPLEAPLPLVWLAVYIILGPVLHYAWIRRAQPTRGSDAGNFTTVGFLVAAFATLGMVLYREPWAKCFALATGLAIAGILLVAGWRLHRSAEVQQ